MGEEISFAIMMNVKRFLIIALVISNFAFLIEILRKSNEIERLIRFVRNLYQIWGEKLILIF